MKSIVFVISNLGMVFLGASAIIGLPGTLVLVLKGAFSPDTDVRAACFGAAKGSGLGFLALLLLSPFILSIGLGFQANVSFDSAMSFVGLTLLSLVITVALTVRGYRDAA